MLDLGNHEEEVILDRLLVKSHFDFIFHGDHVHFFFQLVESTNDSGLDFLSVHILYLREEKGKLLSLLTVKHTKGVNLRLNEDVLKISKGHFGQDKFIVDLFLNQRIVFLGLLEVFLDYFLV